MYNEFMCYLNKIVNKCLHYVRQCVIISRLGIFKRLQDIKLYMQNYWLSKLLLWFENFILQKSSPEFERKKLLIDIKYYLDSVEPKLYDPISNYITVDFAELLFDIYRYSGLIKKSFALDEWETPDKLTETFVIGHLTSLEKELLNQLKPYHFMQIMNHSGILGLNDFICSTMNKLQQSITKSQINSINDSFSRFVELTRLIEFDFEYILSYLMKSKTKNKNSRPSGLESIDFKKTKANILIDKLELLSHIIYSMDLYGDFHTPVSLLGKLKGNRKMPSYELSKLLKKLRSLVKNDYLGLIIAYSKNNPYFRPIQDHKTLPVISKFIKKLQSKVIEYKEEVLKNSYNAEYTQVLHQLFSVDSIDPLRYYNSYYKNQLRILKVDGFNYSHILSCLRHFVVVKYKDIVNSSFLWIGNNISNNTVQSLFSEACELSDKILKYINDLDHSIMYTKLNDLSIIEMLKKPQTDELRNLLTSKVEIVDKQSEQILLFSKKSFQKSQLLLKRLINNYQIKGSLISNINNQSDHYHYSQEWIQAYNDITKFISLLDSFFKIERQLELA